MAAPPFSLQGVRQSLRWPTWRDLLFSTKAVLAVTLSLFIGFSENLDNPYWSALTVYVLLSQPETGAIRSKALFRFGGTLAGGCAAIGLTALFGDSVGLLLVALQAFIVTTLYFKLLDRTPANYFWFSTALTAAVVGIVHVQSPETIFAFGVTRMLEISLAVLAIGLVDSLLGPRPQTGSFLKALEGWRNTAGDWIAGALAPDASDAPQARLERRRALRRITARTAVLDAQGVQLPFDVTDQPPRRADLRLLRLTAARIIGELTSANVWVEAARGLGDRSPEVADLVARTREWLDEKPALTDDAIAAHAAAGEALAGDLAAAADRFIATGERDSALRGTMLTRLGALVRSWRDQDLILHALAIGSRLPADLRRAARSARPVRSIDYLATGLDVLPLVLCFAGITIIWFLSAWSGAINAMLFAFVISAFILGTPGALQASLGVLVWVSIAFALTFTYQFAVLPQVTAFPVLMAVLAVALIPFGIFMSMSGAGLLILANTFAFLGLQNVYAGQFEASLQSLVGSMTGCLITTLAVYVCGFDKARLTARRLSRALARDVADAAGAPWTPRRDRYDSLAVDRLSLFYAAQEGLPAGDPLRGVNMIGRFRVGGSVLALRSAEPDLPRELATAARRLRGKLARAYRRSDPTRERPALAGEVEAVYDAAVASPASPARQQALAALTGLRVAFRPDEAFEALLREAGA